MSDVTIRDLVRALQRQLLVDDVSPAKVRMIQAHATSLLGNANDDLRAQEHAFKVVLMSKRLHHEHASTAKIAAEATDEYTAYLSAKHTVSELEELLKSARAHIRSLDSEMRFQ